MTKKNKAKTEIKESIQLKKIDKKLKSTEKELEKQIVDLTKQVEKLSKKSDKSTAKLLKKAEDNFNEKLAKVQADFEKRIADISAASKKPVSQPAKTTTPAKPKVRVANKPKAATVVKKPTIASLNGVGPMTQKKLIAVGITTLEQIANPSIETATELKQFEKVRGFNTWQAQAKKLLA